MNTQSHYDSDGTLIGFEVPEIYVSRRQIRKMLDTSGVAAGAELGAPLLADDEVRVSFWVDGHKFCVVEPFGDSSVFWIVPEDPSARVPHLLERIQAIFEEHRVPPLRLVVGLVVTGDIVVRPIRWLYSLLRGHDS